MPGTELASKRICLSLELLCIVLTGLKACIYTFSEHIFVLLQPHSACRTLFSTMKVSALIKLLVSIVMLSAVFYLVDLSELKNTFLSIPPRIALLVVLGFTLSQVISAYKWWMMLQMVNLKVSRSEAVKAYFIGMYINCFGFGVVGGDVTRGLIVSKGKPRGLTLATVIADRVHGLAVLALIGAIGAVLFSASVEVDNALLYLLAVIGIAIVACWFLGPRATSRLAAILRSQDTKLQEQLKSLWSTFPTRLWPLIVISAVSAAVHFLQIGLHYLMGLGLGVEISWAALFVAIPFVSILTSLPISWNGLGVRENAYIFFFAPLILTAEQALAFGALWLFAVTIASAGGGVIALLTKDLSVLQEQSEAAPASISASASCERKC